MTEKVARTGLFAVVLTAVCVCCMPFIAQAQQSDAVTETTVAVTPTAVGQDQLPSVESIETLPTENSDVDDAVEDAVSSNESEDSAGQDQPATDFDVDTDTDDAETVEGDKAIEDETVIGDVEADSTSEAVVDVATTPETAPVADSVSVQSAEPIVPQASSGYWVVNDLNNGYGLQRYWYDALGVLAANRLIDPNAEGSGWWAFATEHGFVVRGRYVALDGTIYFADNDGRLANTDWLVTDAYGQGLQRYYIDGIKRGAVQGYSSDGWDHYTTSEGYVLRGNYDTGYGMVYVADNNGRLAAANGWLVTGDYTGGVLQRYYIDQTTHAARSGYFSVDGADYYGLGGVGYVLRGNAFGPDGSFCQANNDGVLCGNGWLVADIGNGQGLQRYWVVNGKTAHDRIISPDEGAGWWAYALSTGAVVRGEYDTGAALVYVANNDGALVWGGSTGWVVADYGMGRGLQRYWIDDASHGAKTSYFTVDSTFYYGLGGLGYVLRGDGVGPYGEVCHANNDGALTYQGWIVTDFGMGLGLQRYWFVDGIVARNRLIDPAEGNGAYWAYAQADGHVLRNGAFDAGAGFVYLGNNDGLLATSEGWLITGDYTNDELQRYYISSAGHGAKTGLYKIGDDWYFGKSEVGYVLLGPGVINGKSAYANNDGVLVIGFSSKVTDSQGNEALISSTQVEGSAYLFLPSYALLRNVSLYVSDFGGESAAWWSLTANGTFSQLISGEIIDFSQISQDSSGARLLYMRRTESSVISTLSVMISGQVQTMYLLSSDPINQGRTYIESSLDHSAKTTGTMLLVNPNGTVAYNDSLSQIKGRGNATWTMSDKRPYQIKLGKKTDLLETGQADNKAKTWVLLANDSDTTLLRNTLGLTIAKELGLNEACECGAVDLYYDGEYRGSYLLCEKVEIGSGRIDVHDLEKDVEAANSSIDLGSLPLATATNAYGHVFQYVVGAVSPSVYKGEGYLLEKDAMYYASESCWFSSAIGYVVVKSPEYCSYEMMKYISELFQESVTTALSGSSAVSSYYDIDSLAQATLVSDFIKNTDYWNSSTYVYTKNDADGKDGLKFYSGSVWDLDYSFGNRDDFRSRPDYAYPFSTQGRYFNGATYSFALSNPTVVASMKNLYITKFGPLVDTILLGSQDVQGSYLHSIDYYVNQVAASQAMNQKIWGIPAWPHQIKPAPTFQVNAQYLKTWVSFRNQWYKNNVDTWENGVIPPDPATCYLGVDYSLVFDAYYYAAHNADVVAQLGADSNVLLQHFVQHGMTEGRDSSPSFNIGAYAANHPDLQQAFGQNWAQYYMHYLDYGFSEYWVCL